jgi:hypothetical protein
MCCAKTLENCHCSCNLAAIATIVHGMVECIAQTGTYAGAAMRMGQSPLASND